MCTKITVRNLSLTKHVKNSGLEEAFLQILPIKYIILYCSTVLKSDWSKDDTFFIIVALTEAMAIDQIAGLY